MLLVADKKIFFRGPAVSNSYLRVATISICLVVIFSVCSASIDFRLTNSKFLNLDGSKANQISKLTRAVHNILRERLVTNSNELTNPVENIKHKIRQELKTFRIQVENAHSIHIHDATSRNNYHDDIFKGKPIGRRKRDTITADTLVSVREKRNISAGFTSDDPYVINKVFRVDKDIFTSRPMLDINVVDMGRHGQFLFTVQETENGRYTFIYFLEKDFKVRQLKQIKTPSATTVEVTKINNHWYFIPVEGNYSLNVDQDPLDIGSHVYRFDLASNTVYKEQTIDTSYAKKALFWKGSGEEANTIYMAVIPQYRLNVKGLIRNNVRISCYHWQGGYLDYVFSIPANNPQSLEHFNIFDNDYLAVANYQDDTESTTIYSEIFKYNHKESNYMSFQKILTYGAKDVKYFRLSSGLATEHFLAIANYCRKDLDGKCEFRLRSVIYKFSGDRFVPFQTIKTNGALQFLPLTSYRKFLLCIVELHGIKFLQYNGWNFVEKLETSFEDPVAFPDNIKLRSFVQNSFPHFSIASTQPGIFSGLYSFEFHQMNNFAEKVDDLYGWCSGAARIVSSANTSDIYQKLLKAPKVNDEKIHLHGSLEFNSVAVNSLRSKSFEYNNFIYGGNFYNDMTQKFHALDVLHGEMKEIEKGLSNVVFRDRNQTVQGKIIFLDVEYLFPKITANKADIIRLNNYKLNEMVPKLLHLSKNYSLDQFSAEEIVAKDSVAIPNLNGHLIFDYAIKSPGIPQKFTGHNTFLKPTKAHNGFDVFGTLNGIHFTENNIKFLLKQGNQTFTGPIVLANSTAKYLYTKYLNGADINNYFREAVLTSGSSIITGNKKFSNVSVKHLFTENILSDINVNDLASKSIYLKGKPLQSFTGKQTQFQKLIVEKMVAASPVIDGNHDLRNFVNVHENSEEYKIEELTLSGGGNIHNLHVNQKLNDYGINSNGRPDILLREDSKVQHIRHKSLNAFYFEKNVDAEEGTINGIHFPSWSNIHRLFLENNHIEGRMDVKGNIEAPAIIVKGSGIHNGSDLIHVLSHIALLSSKTLPGQCHLVFDAIKVKGNTHVSENVNGYDPTQWLRRFSEDGQIISAPKSFLHDLTFLQNTRVKELYDLTLTHKQQKSENIIAVIPDLLTYGGNQTLVGSIRFNRLLTIDKLFGNAIFLDGVPFKDLMLTTGNQNISAKCIFMGTVEVRDELVVRNLSAGLYNEIDLEKAINNTLYKSSPVPQIIEGVYTFEKGFSIENMKALGGVKNYDLSELVQGLVKSNNGVVHLNGTVVFKQGASIENLSFNGVMNGISNKDWGNSWLLNDVHQEVNTPVKFKTLKVENINVRNDKVSGINIAQLNTNSIKTNEPSQLQSTTFTNGGKFLRGVALSDDALLNGHNLLKNTLLTEYGGTQILAGEVTFLDGFTVEENVVANSLGCPHLDLIGKFAHGTNKESYKVQKLVVIGNMMLEHEPEIMNSINDKNWKEYLSDVWWTDRDTEIQREIAFENAVFQKGIVLHRGPVLSGINLEELQKYYAGRNKNNQWIGDVYFKNGMVVHNNFTCRDIAFKNGALFNNVNINDFMNPSTVMINGVDQNIRRPLKFQSFTADQIKLRDGVKINSYSLQTDFMTMGGQNNFITPKRFGDITVTNNTELDGGTKISGVDMQHWQQHAVNKNKNYYFHGPMFFDQLNVDEMSVQGKVNNLKYSEEKLFLTTRRNQVIRGVITMDGTRRPNSYTMNAPEIIVQHTINGYDFDQSAKNLVMKGNRSDASPIVLKGTKTFSGPVYVNQMKMANDKLIYGENMTKILHEISSLTHIPEHLKIPLNDRYSEMQSRITDLQKYAPDQPVFMAHYELVSYINFPTVFTKVVHIDGFPLLSLGIKRPHSIIETSHWSFNLLKNSYVPFDMKVFQNHVQGCIVDFSEIKINGYAAVVTTKRVDNKPVQIDLPLQPLNNNYELYKAEGKLNKAFVLLRIQSKLAVTQVFYSHEFGKLLPFYLFTKSSLQSCIIIQFFDMGNPHAKVLCFNDNNVLYFVQSIALKNPTVMSSMIVSRKTIVAIGEKDDKLKPEGVIDIWTFGDNGVLIKESCIPVINLVHLDSTWTINNNPFLAVAAGYVRGTRNFGAVYIYRYSIHKKVFEKVQTIEIANPLRVRFQLLQVSNEVVLYVLKSSEIDNVLVFKYQGIAGWVQVHQFTSEKAAEMEVLDFQVQNEYYAHLAVSSYTDTKVFSVRFKGKNYYDQGLIVKGKEIYRLRAY